MALTTKKFYGSLATNTSANIYTVPTNRTAKINIQGISHPGGTHAFSIGNSLTISLASWTVNNTKTMPQTFNTTIYTVDGSFLAMSYLSGNTGFVIASGIGANTRFITLQSSNIYAIDFGDGLFLSGAEVINGSATTTGFSYAFFVIEEGAS